MMLHALDTILKRCDLAAVEKQKLVYVLNRDSSARLTISSPLEAHKHHTIVFACAGLDVNYDNPIFACLEVDYGDYEAGEEEAEDLEKVPLMASCIQLHGFIHQYMFWSFRC